MKETTDEVAIRLALAFQASLNKGNISDEWQKAIVTPMFKDGNKGCSKTDYYRPISLTPITCKVLEHIVDTKEIYHLDQQRMLTDVQHGLHKS